LRRINFIFFLLILLNGCSVVKNDFKTATVSSEISESELISDIRSRNLTNSSFYIEKAEFSFIEEGKSEKLIGSIKFEAPEKFLVSLKTRAGIEVVRALLTKDTLLINDRVNRVHYYGYPGAFERKYGVSIYLLPLFLGDFLDEKDEVIKDSTIKEGRAQLQKNVYGKQVLYEIDVQNKKVKVSTVLKGYSGKDIKIFFSKFLGQAGLLFPERIEISDQEKNVILDISIQKILLPWKGALNLIPGSDYKRVQLL
jgi:hypothetical protein